MTRADIQIDRRRLLTGLAAVPLVPALPALAMPPTFEARLAEALRDLPSGAMPVELSAVRFEAGADHCAAVIRLDWPPGMRQRLFKSGGADADAAFSAVLAEIEMYFRPLV